MEIFKKPTYSDFPRDGFFELKRVQITLDLFSYHVLLNALADAAVCAKDYATVKDYVNVREEIYVEKYKRTDET